ncbi:octaprenyl-diphosphate synthase [Dysgonomonadaceae bacterium PH5-43]|nr:octaprenyl-diphosphate synthase [Dysgonomonadaceae bacterium PH5-43]
MDKINLIIEPVRREIEEFNKLFDESLRGKQNFQFLVDFIAEKQGKKIRPLILILSAKLCGEPTFKTLEYAVILELLHTATLIHDDVVDSTLERRGNPSVNAKFDNKAAVLLGDYILSQAIIKGVNTENIRFLKLMSNLSNELVEGELIQMVSSSDTIVDENRYFEIIRKKTAVLLSSCTEMGAVSVNASEEKVDNLRLIGENLGLCFQIRDDLFDYYEQGEIGKPTGNDIREGKITLPLIYALNTSSQEAKSEMIKIIENKDFTPNNIAKLIAFAKENNGIEYAQNKMNELKQEILTSLDLFDNSEAKKAMFELVNYIIEREK